MRSETLEPRPLMASKSSRQQETIINSGQGKRSAFRLELVTVALESLRIVTTTKG